MQNVPHSWATLCSLTWRIRVHAMSHSSAWRADRLFHRSQWKSSRCSADSRAPGPLQPHRPEPDHMLRAPHCTCNKWETALVFTIAISHTGKHTVSLLLVYKDSHHAQGSGYSTGVLATCATKTGQHMLRGIVTLSLKDGWFYIQYIMQIQYIQYNTLHSTLSHTCVSARIGRHMASFATRRNPMATSSTLITVWFPFATACERKCNKNEEKQPENVTQWFTVQ